MEMESTRRSFDRSREQIKKPRLSTDDQSNPNGRAFAPRPTSTAASVARFRELEGGYQPQAPGQAQQYQELVSQYKMALGELTFNSKPIITNLTIIAGENLHAAKAIAATVCNNILEVPSDQKLPSLYLLDSIVKNIGKDYIKYFAARLPEVFCKAYRQVDSPVHQSMRHLFGTWKGVFPPQPLQAIERELGFSPAVNGSSAGSATSRPDSQRAHSIHVNPKYLERQRIQQSTRAKGMGSDMTPIGTVEDERPERAVGLGVGRPWVDPSVKIQNIQRPLRGALNEAVHEKKKVTAVYGDFDYSSDVSRNTGIGRTTGRVPEQGLEKSWYGANSNAADAISAQRNGFSIKNGVPSYLTPKPANVNLPQTQSNARSGSGMSPSWKNSEEEEFMWEMHSRLPDQDAVSLPNNLRKDRWTPDDSDKMEFNVTEVGSRFDRETSSDSLSTEQKEYSSFGRRLSSPWRLQELNPADGGSISAGQSEGYSVALGASGSSSLARMAGRGHAPPVGTSGVGLLPNVSSGSTQQKFPSLMSTSPSRQSPMHQRAPSPSSSLPSRYPHQKLQNSSEPDYPQSQAPSRPDYKGSQYSGGLLPSTVQSGNLQKFQSEDLQAAASSLSTIQPGRQYPSRQPDTKNPEPSRQTLKPRLPLVSRAPTSVSAASGNSDLLTAEPSGQSSTSSLLASVMKSGILSNISSVGLPSQSFQDVGQISSQLSIQPPPTSTPPTPPFSSSGPVTTSASLSSSLSPDSSSTVSQRKHGQPRLAAGSSPSIQNKDAANKSSNPISNLLSSLVAKGLLSASKSETPSVLPLQKPTQSKKQSPKVTASSSTPLLLKPEAPSPLQPQVPSQSDKQNQSNISADSTPLPLPISSEIPHSSTTEVSPVEPDGKSSQPTSVEIHNLIGLEFKPDVIREFHPPVISALFDDLPHECSLCGLRLKLRDRFDRHMEWHNWKNGDLEGVNKLTRRWYADSSNWIMGRAELALGVESSSSMDDISGTADEDEDESVVPANEDQCVCVLCGELFEDYYSQRTNKWMFKGAIHMTLPPRVGEVGDTNDSAEGPIAHINCISENSLHDLGLDCGA